MSLKITYGNKKSALFACKIWHYSKCIPALGIASIFYNIYEDDKFIGVIIYSKGAASNINTPYNLKQNEVLELTRVALNKHNNPVSRILSITLKMLKRDFPNLKLIVSYADSNQGHLGKIYQATNWIYEGSSIARNIFINGKMVHSRSLSCKHGSSSIDFLKKLYKDVRAEPAKPKYKYLMPLDKETRKQIEKLREPYPKISEYSVDRCTPVIQTGSGGAEPTYSLNLNQGSPNA